MKRLIWIILFIGLLFFGYQNKTAIAARVEQILYSAPCETPRTYAIGTIDPNFNLSEAELLQATQEASAIWKNADGNPLIVYDPKAKLTISLIYDERQYLNTQVTDLNNQVEKQKDTLKPEITEYEKRAADFKRRNADLNGRIDYWNNKGGAPEEEYNKLIQEQQALQQEAQILQAMAQSLNQSTDDYNTQVQELEKKVDVYNTTLQGKPEEGEYIVNGREEKIVIYFHNSHQELVHTIAHELGHALGMPHNTNPSSLMYPRTNESTSLSNDDLAALAEVCRKRSIAEVTGERLSFFFEELKNATDNALSKQSN